jgi:hypothetical protein
MGTFDQFIKAIPQVTMSRDSMPSLRRLEILAFFPVDRGIANHAT